MSTNRALVFVTATLVMVLAQFGPVHAEAMSLADLRIKFGEIVDEVVTENLPLLNGVCEPYQKRPDPVETHRYDCKSENFESRSSGVKIAIIATLFNEPADNANGSMASWSNFNVSQTYSPDGGMFWENNEKYLTFVESRPNNRTNKYAGYGGEPIEPLDVVDEDGETGLLSKVSLKVILDHPMNQPPDVDIVAFTRIAGNIILQRLTSENEVLEVKLYDVNPLFSADGKTFFENWTQDHLLFSTPVRLGTTADGVSQVVLRAETKTPTTVNFSISDPDDGTIETLFDGKTIEVEKTFTGDKYYAFALYSPPETFDPPGGPVPNSAMTPPKKRLGDHLQIRDAEIEIHLDDGATTVEPVMLARPPAVLVHGLFSDPVQTWAERYDGGESMVSLLERAGFLPFLVNYQNSNGTELTAPKGEYIEPDDAEDTSWLLGANSTFNSNRRVVWDSPLSTYKDQTLDYGYALDDAIPLRLSSSPRLRIGGIKQALNHYRNELSIASTQAIVVGHSMGGLLTRIWASKKYNPTYERAENFGKGDIDRILTLNTPHFGSELMELKDAVAKASIGKETWFEWGKRSLVKTVLWWYLDPERGAIRDLRTTSKALVNIGKTQIPSFAIATNASSAEIGDKLRDPLKAYQSLYTFAGQLFFNNRPLLDDFIDKRFGEWERAPQDLQINTIGPKPSDTGNNSGGDGGDVSGADNIKAATALDLRDKINRLKYKRIIDRNIEGNAYYWAARRNDKYQNELSNTIENAVIVPFGDVDTSVSDYENEDYENLELLTHEKLKEADVQQISAEDEVKEVTEATAPETFLSLLRDLIFHQDANTDGAVRVVSQIGGIDDGSHELIERVIHSYSPWDYKVQRRVISLLKWENAAFSDNGFPEAGQVMPFYMPSDSIAPDIVSGARAVTWSGLVPSHAAAFQATAQREKVFILVRPVNSSSTQLLKNCHESENKLESCAAAKGMNVKGKSSSWGPQIGYIPVNQRYSKLWRTVRDPARRRDQIDKYDGEVKKSLSGKHPKRTDRTFAVRRALRMQTSKGLCDVVTDDEAEDAENGVFFKCGDSYYDWKNSTRNGKPFFDVNTALATPIEMDTERKTELDNSPMYVLADGTSNTWPRLYLTADYDLLAIGQQFVKSSCRPKSKQPPCRPNIRKDVAESKFDKLSGVVSPWQDKFLDRLNAAVTKIGYTGGNVSHHGPENQYDGSPYVDYPIIVFAPTAELDDITSPFLIRQGPPGFRDIHLKRFVAAQTRLGYNIWPNGKSSGWQWETRKTFSPDLGYDPRDASNLPPYVDEAPEPIVFEARKKRDDEEAPKDPGAPEKQATATVLPEQKVDEGASKKDKEVRLPSTDDDGAEKAATAATSKPRLQRTQASPEVQRREARRFWDYMFYYGPVDGLKLYTEDLSYRLLSGEFLVVPQRL
ncbi:MAG: anthrax toxin-like adenylyl cyclase domain-containing protein [Rhizobiaceae bacterium]